MNEHRTRQRAFRVAFDYLEQQAVKINGYTDSKAYFSQAWNELMRLSESAESELGKDLLIRSYEELERLWRSNRPDPA